MSADPGTLAFLAKHFRENTKVLKEVRDLLKVLVAVVPTLTIRDGEETKRKMLRSLDLSLEPETPDDETETSMGEYGA